jgi:hypothetical protein
MKKFIIVLLVIVLAACSSPVPTEQPIAAPVESSPTPVVIVQTVVVEATQAPTEVPPPTAVPPTEVPPTAVPPTAAPVVVTVVVEATQPPAAQAPAPVVDANAPIPLDNVLGKGVFTNMTMTSSNLTLRCSPRDITFNITTSNTAIADVMFFYRITDINRQYPKDYKPFGKMTVNGNGNFTLVFSGEDVHPDVRLDGGWLDFQFVGLAKDGNVVDRSQTIESLVKYTFDCP